MARNHHNTNTTDTISPKQACKLVFSLSGIMMLLGLSWILSVFTSVGSSTNRDASFALQFLFVFFNTLQGFYVFLFLVILSFDARKAWINILCPYQKLLKLSTRHALKNNGNISATNKESIILSSTYSIAALKSSVKQNNQLEIDNETAVETDFVDESCVEKP